KPEVWLHVELGADQALAVLAAGIGDLADAVEHQHRRQWQLGIAGAEHLAPAAGQQILVLIAVAPIEHRLKNLSNSRLRVLGRDSNPAGDTHRPPAGPTGS